jgi:hypothetical protein
MPLSGTGVCVNVPPSPIAFFVLGDGEIATVYDRV